MSPTQKSSSEVPTSPALVEMLRDAALLHHLDAEAAQAVARTGAMEIGGAIVVVTVLPKPEEEGAVDNDVAIVCPLHGLQADDTASHLMLTSNLPLVLALGCAFACTDDGEPQLVHATRLEHLDAQRLAHKLSRMAAVAGAIRRDLEGAAQAAPAEAVAG